MTGLFAIRAVHLRTPKPTFYSHEEPRYDLLTAVKFEVFPAILLLQCTVLATPAAIGPVVLKLTIGGPALGGLELGEVKTRIDHIEPGGELEYTQLFAGNHELNICAPGYIEFRIRQNDGEAILHRVMRVKKWARPAPPTQPTDAA